MYACFFPTPLGVWRLGLGSIKPNDSNLDLGTKYLFPFSATHLHVLTATILQSALKSMVVVL